MFPTLEFGTIDEVLLGREQETPPVIALPATFSDKSLVINTVGMGFAPPTEGNPIANEDSIRGKSQEVLQDSAGAIACAARADGSNGTT